eukprot:12254797-Prorocentrum_lima.AAC.1
MGSADGSQARRIGTDAGRAGSDGEPGVDSPEAGGAVPLATARLLVVPGQDAGTGQGVSEGGTADLSSGWQIRRGIASSAG